MKNLKKYESFVNEELSPETYLSAADKLKKKGHKNRADKLTGYVNELSKKIDPIELDMYGEKYNIGPDNIFVNSDGTKGKDIEMFIFMDKEYAISLTKDGDWGKAVGTMWDKQSDEKKENFVEEFNMPKSMVVKSWTEFSDDEQNAWNEYYELNASMIHIMSEDDDPDLEMDGLIIADRRNANKLLKFLKEWGKTQGGRLNQGIQKLTVNDIYHD